MSVTKKIQVRYKSNAEIAEQYDAERLYRMKFQDTAYVIAKMDTLKKAEVSSDIQYILTSLYEAANRYGNPNIEKEAQPTAEQFRGIMGKIKHWETLLYWLFEIDIMMTESTIQDLIRVAEQEYAKTLQSDDASLQEKAAMKLEKLEASKEIYTAHTAEIMGIASELTKKYFG